MRVKATMTPPPIRPPEPWRPLTAELYPSGVQYGFPLNQVEHDLGNERFAFLFSQHIADSIQDSSGRAQYIAMYMRVASVTTRIIQEAMESSRGKHP